MRLLVDVLRQLRWQDVVDVAILTFVLIKAYGWLRGTVAFQVALGMLTLVGASFGASAAGLVLTGYVLQTIGTVAVLMAVVIFREEIRRGLGRASPLRWLRERRRGSGAPAAVGPLAEGLFQLARRRIGALVLLPRADDFREHLTGGTEIDALVSPQLLEALFHHGSPLHDGAMVVERERARRAGAFLPLSTSPDLPEQYGTRHRAAIGITELCDVIALIVSEERGEVSVASGGRIETVSSATALGRRVDDLMRQPGHAHPPRRTGVQAVASRRASVSRRLYSLVAHVAIVIGVLGAWYAVAGERGSVITRTVPVELVGVPASLRFEAPEPDHLALQLRGPRRVLLSLGPADLRATLDLSRARPGANDLAVFATAPSGVQVVSVDPPRVSVEVLEERTLPVQPALDQGFPRSLRVRAVAPAEIAVIGRSSVFHGLDAIRTRPVKLSTIAGGMARTELSLQAGLRLADERQRNVMVLFEEPSPPAGRPAPPAGSQRTSAAGAGRSRGGR